VSARAAGAFAALVLGASVAGAQEDAPLPSFDDSIEQALEGALPEGFSEPDAYLALLANDAGRHLHAREQAETILARDPDSLGAHVALGIALYQGEGNLGLARYHFRRALDLFEVQYGLPPGEDAPWMWHVLAYKGLASANVHMGRDAETLEVLDERDRYYGYRPGDRAWPLMRLGRYEEAREAALIALEMEDQPQQHAQARIGLCGVAGELLDRPLAHGLCVSALEHAADDPGNETVLLSNAAEAALGVLRFDAAERFYLEATGVPTYGTPANPWMELTRMYVAQARVGEARDAMRRMFAWRAAQPAIVDAETRSAIDLTSSVFLLAVGRPGEAVRVAARGVDRPDRQGAISFLEHARNAGAALMDRIANRAAAEAQWERAAWLPWREAWRARGAALLHGLRGWWSGRRARGLLADERLLLHTVVPYGSGSAILPEWLQPELVEVVGAGPISAVLREARDHPDSVPGDEGYLLALEAEVAHQLGRSEQAVAATRGALEQLPKAEVLLRARVAARGAQDALDTGDRSLALDWLDRALQADPGVVRRLGIAIPCVFELASGGVARRAGELLADSPRLDAASSGFRLRTRDLGHAAEACLIGPTGSLHACAQVAPEPDETEDAQARRLAAALHDAALAPRIDLTQADLDSLDGATTTVGIRGTDRVREVLSDWGLGADAGS
jgi:tetratricopeptide (TPR) repeat protein